MRFQEIKDRWMKANRDSWDQLRWGDNPKTRSSILERRVDAMEIALSAMIEKACESEISCARATVRHEDLIDRKETIGK